MYNNYSIDCMRWVHCLQPFARQKQSRTARFFGCMAERIKKKWTETEYRELRLQHLHIHLVELKIYRCLRLVCANTHYNGFAHTGCNIGPSYRVVCMLPILSMHIAQCTCIWSAFTPNISRYILYHIFMWVSISLWVCVMKWSIRKRNTGNKLDAHAHIVAQTN